MGKKDNRIMEVMVKERIKDKILVKGRWIKKNEEEVEVIKDNKDILDVEKNGEMNVKEIKKMKMMYGIKKDGYIDEVRKEIEGGEEEIKEEGMKKKIWYRDEKERY